MKFGFRRYEITKIGETEVFARVATPWDAFTVISRHPGNYFIKDTEDNSIIKFWMRPDIPKEAFGVGVWSYGGKKSGSCSRSCIEPIGKTEPPAIFNGFTQGW